jgi:hypothetical protein
MADDFKKTLFDYLMGKLPSEQGITEEIFKEINEISRNEWSEFFPTSWNNFRYEGLIEVADSELLVLYGGYKVYQTDEVRGIITILNNNFEPIKTFYQYDSGTYLRYIQCMIQEEDGTFSLIDCPDFPRDEDWSFTVSQKRFVMLNNFAQQTNNDYFLTLRRSYFLPTDYFNFYCRKMYKDINSSHYVLVGNYLRDQTSPDFDGIRIIELQVNTGSENEWTRYDDDSTGWLMGDSYVEFDDDNFFLEILLSSTIASSTNLYIWTKNFTETSLTLKNIASFDFQPFVDSISYNNQSVFLNRNECYLVQNNQQWGRNGIANSKYIGLYYYNIQTGEFKTIYENYLGDYDFCNLESIYIVENNNDLYIEFNDNINSIDSGTVANYYFQRLENYHWQPIKISEQQFFIYNQRTLYVKSNYNLLNWFSYAINPRRESWKVYNFKENYNSSNFNGESYINTNALIPNSSEIYSNESLVFARNLYNKTINNNTTVSTVEIPNTYLNGIDLTSKNLLSETNLTMITDTNVTQKNIYETMFLNFINVLQVVDRNNVIQVLNQEASTYLNNAINTDNSYNNAKLYNKVIINYEDNSSKEISYSFDNTTETSTTIVFSVYVDKIINNAEIVSNDKTIVYQTIDLSNLEITKSYTIKQKLEVV